MRSIRMVGHSIRRPPFLLHDRVQDLVCGDVAEVQVGRQCARGLGFRFVARRVVVRQTRLHEASQRPPCGDRPAGTLACGYFVVDGQLGEPRGLLAQRPGRRSGPARQHLTRDYGTRPGGQGTDGVRARARVPMVRELLLQEAPERVRRREGMGRGCHGQDAIGIHRLQTHRQARRSACHERRQEEARIVVGDDDTGVFRERVEHAAPGARLRLDVGVIRGDASFEALGIVGHAVDDERVHPIVRPGVGCRQRLENDQWFPELTTPLCSAIEPEVPLRAPAGDHPIENKTSFVRHGPLVDGAHSQTWDLTHGPSYTWLRSMSSLGWGSRYVCPCRYSISCTRTWWRMSVIGTIRGTRP